MGGLGAQLTEQPQVSAVATVTGPRVAVLQAKSFFSATFRRALRPRGLTLRSSGLAYGQPLTSNVRPRSVFP